MLSKATMIRHWNLAQTVAELSYQIDWLCILRVAKVKVAKAVQSRILQVHHLRWEVARWLRA